MRAVEKQGTSHWQQVTPACNIYTSRELTVGSTIQKIKGVVPGAYFGGMVFTETAQGSKKYRAEISSIPKHDEHALCLDRVDQVSTT